jgi:thiol:disulfide interchange protein DsbD
LLEAERAFALSAQAVDPQTLLIRYDIAAGYYLYRDKFRFSVEPGALAASPTLPAGKVKDDAFFGRVEVFRGSVTLQLPLDRDRPGEKLTLVAESQGCADLGVCYPLQRQTLAVALPVRGGPAGPVVEAAPRRKGWFN